MTTFGGMKAAVKRNADSMPDDHPHASAIGDYVNEAANKVILMAYAADRRAMNAFPELRNRRWASDATVDGQGEIDMPSTLLILESARITKSTGVYSPSTQREYDMTEITDPGHFAFLDKTTTGWPVMWTRHGSVFSFWPTCSADPDYRTRIVLTGVRKEVALTSDSQSFAMNELWHPAVITCATAITLKNLREFADAREMMAAVKEDVTATLNLVGLEALRNRVNIQIAGMPK